MKASGLLIFIAALSLAGCGNSENQRIIPRRTAYPRPQLPDTVLADYKDAPLHFEVNSDATTSSPKEGWLNIRYPMLGATVHVTFTPTTTSDIDEVRHNRMERLMLNAGDRPSNHSEFTNSEGFDILLSETDGATTPVQFLASDGERWVVSGAAYFDNPAATSSSDSIRPMIKAIKRDLLEALKNLSER